MLPALGVGIGFAFTSCLLSLFQRQVHPINGNACGNWQTPTSFLRGWCMTKRDRLSFALRRLRNLKGEGDLTLRMQGTHQIVTEVLDELSTGSQHADLGSHVIELLEELNDRNAKELGPSPHSCHQEAIGVVGPKT